MSPSEQELHNLAVQLGECLKSQGLKLALAESCTGGWLAKIITDIPGSSAWFSCSIVCYSNESKHHLLGVTKNTLHGFGAVSEETVLALADGLFYKTDADVVVSVSGIAGPDGGSPDGNSPDGSSDGKPVGLVWLSDGKRGNPVQARSYHFDGEREDVRKHAIKQALINLLDLLGCE